MGIVFVSTNVSFSQKKNWNIGVGSAFTSYDFITSSGNKVDYLKNGSGNSYRLGYEQSLVDTTKFLGQSTPRAIYFLNHKGLAKVLSKLNIGLNVVFNQLNAVGDIQNISFDYQTNYAGLQFTFGPKISLGKNWDVNAKGILSGQHILQGNQHVNYSFVDLTKDPAFKGLKFFTGYEISLEKQINNTLRFYLSGSQIQTSQAKQEGLASLNFKTTGLMIGIKITGF